MEAIWRFFCVIIGEGIVVLDRDGASFDQKRCSNDKGLPCGERMDVVVVGRVQFVRVACSLCWDIGIRLMEIEIYFELHFFLTLIFCPLLTLLTPTSSNYHS